MMTSLGRTSLMMTNQISADDDKNQAAISLMMQSSASMNCKSQMHVTCGIVKKRGRRYCTANRAKKGGRWFDTVRERLL
jgi:hypothetical protein